jgi:hypothetical protein
MNICSARLSRLSATRHSFDLRRQAYDYVGSGLSASRLKCWRKSEVAMRRFTTKSGLSFCESAATELPASSPSILSLRRLGALPGWNAWGDGLVGIGSPKQPDSRDKVPGGYLLPEGKTMADVRRLDLELLASEGLNVKDHRPEADWKDGRPEDA